MMLIVAIYILGVLGSALAHATIRPPQPLPHVHAEITGAANILQARDLWKRQDQCDQSQFYCPTGTCFSDPANGYIGCCSVSSCAPRTRCIEYDPALTTRPCDPNTGGCIYCSRSDNPHCVRITNVGAGQWIQYCATTATQETLSYVNVITTGSQWYASSSTTTTSSSSSTTPLSTSSSSSTSRTSSSSKIAALQSTSSGTTQTTSSTSSPTSSSTSSSTSTEAAAAAGTSTISGGAIGGVVAGAVFGVSAILAAIWLLWRRSANKRMPSVTTTTPEKHIQDRPTPPHGTKEDPAEAEGSTPKEPSQFYSPNGFSQYHEADSRPVSTSVHPAVRFSGKGLGIRPVERSMQKRSSRYTISNPDPVSPVSAQTSQFVSPVLPQQEGSSPSTVQSSLPKTPVSDRYYANLGYTPSVYAADPPGSIAQPSGARPPSLPQPYSTVTVAGEAPAETPASGRGEQRSGVYRGLSTHTGESVPPWAYLSPENAVNGGWVNNHD